MAGCASTVDIAKLKEKNLLIGMEKGSCYGKCSVYNIKVYKNRVVVYEGIANVDKYGLYSKKLTKEELNNLISSFEVSNFFKYDSVYPSSVIDFPMIKLFYSTS